MRTISGGLQIGPRAEKNSNTLGVIPVQLNSVEFIVQLL